MVDTLGYIRPSVMVFQEFLLPDKKPVLPVLNTVLVGPNYMITDKGVARKADGANPNVYSGANITNIAYPDLAFPNIDLINHFDIFFKGVTIRKVTGGNALIAAADNLYTDINNQSRFVDTDMNFLATGTNPLGISKGDIIVIGTSNYIVKSVDSATTLTIEGIFSGVVGTGIPASFAYTITSKIAEVKLKTIDYVKNTASFDLAANIAAVNPVTSLPVPVIEVKEILTTYRALRPNSTNSIFDVKPTDADIERVLGKIDIRNPLAAAAKLALSNTLTKIKALPVNTDDAAGYANAINVLELSPDVYAIVPLTQDLSVIKAIQTHIKTASTPAVGKWRLMFWSPELIKEKDLISNNVGTTGTLSAVASTDELTLNDIGNQGFISKGTAVGDYVLVGGGTPAASAVYKVNRVLTESRLELKGYFGVSRNNGAYSTAAPFIAVAAGAVSYTVFRVLDKDGQALALGELAQSFSDRRICQVVPNTLGDINIRLLDNDIIAPRYYLAAAIGGLCAGAPPHQGFTNLGIVGVSLSGRNSYFSETQMNAMAGRGVYIVAQDTENTMAYTRHQLTTDMTHLKTRELSVTKNVDFVSLFIVKQLKEFLGIYNITPATIALALNKAEATITFLKENTLPKIGASLVNAKIIQLDQDPAALDTLRLVIDIKVPFPVNFIRVTLNI